ncbi:MAG: zonular occludens toxin domain-containing protein [Pseudomonadaceae bacterium]|nr:zonular occludens toxin domain-containing protein [Pseudomonadaceae bacterium]
MLVFRTGLQGHGKTLNAIKEIDAKAKSEGRPVYYHNVNGLKPEKLKAQWYQFDDPHKWFELPDNSIVLIDEAQRFFGVRDPRKAVPDYCSQFETMRHDGLEVHLVTQHASFLDAHIRKLCNKHIYVLRIFGGQKLSRYEAEKYIDVEKQTALKDASHSFVKLDSKFFGVYDSAVEHHFKFRPPGKLLIIPVLILFIAFMLYRAFDSFNGRDAAKKAQELATSAASGAAGILPGVVPPADGGSKTKTLTAAEYVEARKPRIPDLPSSAPIYDSLTKPKTYPRLSCMISSDPSYIDRNSKRYRVVAAGEKSYICECFTQQGTWHKTTFAFCKNSVEYGSFDAAIADRTSLSLDGTSNKRAPIAAAPQAPPEPPQMRLTIIPDSSRTASPSP